MLVSTACASHLFKAQLNQFSANLIKKLQVGMFFSAEVFATGASMLYFWSLASRHLPVIMSSGVSWVISGVGGFGFRRAFLPSAVIWRVRVVLGSTVRSFRFFSWSVACCSSGLKSSKTSWGCLRLGVLGGFRRSLLADSTFDCEGVGLRSVVLPIFSLLPSQARSG